MEQEGAEMITLIVFYIDGSETKYICKKVRYDAQVIFAEINGGKKLCIPYVNTYAVIEEERDT